MAIKISGVVERAAAMTDPRSREADGEHDAPVERMLTKGLATQPLEDGGIERLRATVSQEWRATLSTDERRPRWRRRGWRVGLVAAAVLAGLVIGVISIVPTAQQQVVGSLVRLNDGTVEIRSGLLQ